MNIVPWKEAKNDVSRGNTTTREGEVVEEAVVASNTIKKRISSSSSSSWMKSKDPRIFRVSRAFGGKDRHSKVCTLRGLRDRRVRLSVPTAIQLYDLQDRLGVDQPSKAVEWLIDAAKEEIDELPPLPVSPETFSLFNHHHHQSFLNLGQPKGQDPNQINGAVEKESTSREKNNKILFSDNHHHIGSYDSMEHHQHSSFQSADYQQFHHTTLVPLPSQILLCPMKTSTTIQSLFPSSSADERQMVSHFQVPLMGSSSASTSQNISTLYSLLHGGSSSCSSNNNMNN